MNGRHMSQLLGKLLRILEKADAGGNFRVLPVPDAPCAEAYRKAINPLVDFSIIHRRINMLGYTQVSMLKDLEQLYQNTVKFNTEEHDLAKTAQRFVIIAKQFIEEYSEVGVSQCCDE